jgi:hypothetical protein
VRYRFPGIVLFLLPFLVAGISCTSGKPQAQTQQTSGPAANAGGASKTPQAMTTPTPAATQKSAHVKPSLTPSREEPLESAAGEEPAIAFDATVVQLGTVMEGDEATCVYNVRNVGKKDLNILSAQPG